MNARRRDTDAPTTDEERLHERLSAYVDGELTPEERGAVEADVAANAEARELLAELEQLRTALAELELVPAPRSFAITAPPQPAGGGLFARFELMVRAAAAGLAVLFVAVVVGGGSLSVGGPPTGVANGFGRDVAPAAAPAEESAAERQAEAFSGANDEDAADTALDAPEAAPVPEADTADAPIDPEVEYYDDLGDVATDDGEVVVEPPTTEALTAPQPEAAPFEARTLATSESFGGVSASLGALAVLFAALAVLLALGRRSRA